MNNQRIASFVVIVLVLLITGCQYSQKQAATGDTSVITISETDFGTKWPFTVASGELRCDNGAVSFTVNGWVHGVNGLAKSRYKKDANYQDIATILKENPDIPGATMDTSPIIQKGLELCK